MVVTGAGLVTALGVGWSRNAGGFRAGRTAFRPVTLFDVSRQRTKFAAEVDLPALLPPGGLGARQMQRLDRAARLLLLAAHEAWRQAGWEPSENLPVVLGTTSGGMSAGEAYYRQAIHEPRRQRGQATRVTQYQVQQQGLDLAAALGFRGPLTFIANACASGANAIGHAFELIRNGRAERVLTGGYDALSQLVFAGFDSLQALSPTQCRPFDAQRDGLALGEGAAAFRRSAALARGIEDEMTPDLDRGQILSRFAALLDSALASEPPPDGIDAEILAAAIDGRALEDQRQCDTYALWAAMTALTQEIKLQGRAFQELNLTLGAQPEKVAAELRLVYGERERTLQREAERRCRRTVSTPDS